ncbi:uncharacterized protein BP5553_10632 [Venustampulla echinocandica]|uniref:Uncharacterized protein n=1 Tax=Venustampulla echinocandica TaxID=2656787 RepID=A0A370T930_9HELO|nr:uncharacterized protein BP5553_10632 [Venustampulla echinocandica]RDL30005.1 hypothetical protein BP5553_10632 [Venustampulla echinocandica]
MPDLPFFWASQIDTELGYWDTPWAIYYYRYELESLPAMIDNIHEEIILADLWTKLRNGGHTWPPYALNARGGTSEPEPHMFIDFKVFNEQTERLPPILLLESVRDHYGGRNKAAAQILNQDRTTELASLDHWFSQAAKTDSISNGVLNIIQYAPAIIHDVYIRFRYEILQLRHLDKEREKGDVRIRKLAEEISDSLYQVRHSEVEHYFIWVVLLRAVKVMQCVKDGADTWAAQKIFSDDLLVYFT